MPDYKQAERPLAIRTPLGEDALLLTELRGREAISELFHFELGLLGQPGTDIRFDRILGESATIKMRLLDGNFRYFNGIVNRFAQGRRDEYFIHYRAEVVPQLWLLTKKVRSRIFQQIPVPEILRAVLTGMPVRYELLGTYHPRDYCVQYHESDFAFASRLMEEEGIHYFFRHSEGRHELIVSDATNPFAPGQSEVIYEEARGEFREDMRITGWEKIQELRSCEYTLWDHSFELPGNHLETTRQTVGTVTVGKVTHKLRLPANEPLEIYDYPGAFAQRFDGIEPGGIPRPQELRRIFEDRDRTVRVRMEQEDAAALEIQGASDCGNFTAGHKFTLERHWDANGAYLLTAVEHEANQGDYRSEQSATFQYSNRFVCLPAGIRYRPQRVTAKPVIAGVQTATVVGPEGEEIFVDKYGRVKVQFHWDREGKMDGNSSCWLRVAQVWAGKGWGAFFWPRIGHEVVVTFEEGDPDQPLIIGSVYNAENMPWFTLPVNKQLGGFKSASVSGTAQKNYNGVVFNDEKGHEHLSVHSEHNMSLNSEFDKMFHAGRHKGERVGVANMLTVGKLVPFGGGSGGGSFNAGDTIPEPVPMGVLGLNSVVTYGENFQATAGLNHQMTLGNNIQICVNPLGLAAGVPGSPAAPALTSALGAGLGGDLRFTIGSSANFVLGQKFDINLGPPKIEISGPYSDHPGTVILCGVLGAAVTAWTILYDALTEDAQRAQLAIAFQAFVDGVLIAILAVEMAMKKAKQEIVARYVPDGLADQSDWGILSIGAGAASLGSMRTPLEAIDSE
jgi:type VI secretion system secreted protein VgrG